jgi:hypothetical protein
MRLTWKKERETGLAAVCAGPAGSELRLDGQRIGGVYPLGGDWRGPLRGWFWSVSDSGSIAYRNTHATPKKTEKEAKDEAVAYVRLCLGASAPGRRAGAGS